MNPPPFEPPRPRRPLWVTAIAAISWSALGLAGLLTIMAFIFLPAGRTSLDVFQILLGLTVIPLVAVVVMAIRRLVRRSPSPPGFPPPQLDWAPPMQLESRLLEIDHLLQVGRITPDEHAAMRSRILDLR